MDCLVCLPFIAPLPCIQLIEGVNKATFIYIHIYILIFTNKAFVLQNLKSPTHICIRHTLVSNKLMYPSPTYTCTQHTCIPEHLYLIHTCIWYPLVSDKYTLVSDTHLYPTNTCIQHTLVHFTAFNQLLVQNISLLK